MEGTDDMAPRGFNRYMLLVGAGTNRKFARLSDAERNAHFLGVLSVAAQSPTRGYLFVADGEEAGAEEIAVEAGVSVAVAKSAMEKLKRVGVLVHDEDLGGWFVHDWDEVNPPPRKDSSNADRQRAFRARNASRNGESNATVTAGKVPCNANEVEVEVEVEEKTNNNTPSSLRADVIEAFAYWQERCRHPTARLTAERRRKIETRLREGYTVHAIRQAIDGAARAAFVNDAGKRFDDIELICRTGSKLEDFIDRAVPTGNVRPLQRPASIAHMDRWKQAAEYQGESA